MADSATPKVYFLATTSLGGWAIHEHPNAALLIALMYSDHRDPDEGSPGLYTVHETTDPKAYSSAVSVHIHHRDDGEMHTHEVVEEGEITRRSAGVDDDRERSLRDSGVKFWDAEEAEPMRYDFRWRPTWRQGDPRP